MDAALDSVLHRVAAGELSPEEALRLLDPPAADSASTPAEGTAAASEPGVGAPDYGTPPEAPGVPAGVQDNLGGRAAGGLPGAGDPPPYGRSSDAPPAGVRVRVSHRQVEVIADPTVAGAVVTGEHTMSREGDLLVAEATDGPPIFGDGTEEGGQRFQFSNLPKALAWARSLKDHAFVVRVNPMLPVELDVIACSVRVSGLEAGARIRLVAASLKAERLRGPLDVDLLTSSLKGSLGPNGRSRIVAESSSVKVNLLEGTGLRIRANNRMGKVLLPSKVGSSGFESEAVESVVGSGDGELLVESLMSSVVIGGPDAA